MTAASRKPVSCLWCGRELASAEIGRRRRYCRQSCRQRAYEQRNAVKGTSIPTDAVVLTADAASALTDRIFEVRCAAEDIASAVAEDADRSVLTALADRLVALARDAERFR
ncbi:hypothetical protein [Rhodococcus spongiicola]|uniref:FCS-type domain-containing protein n=1 Tax=Rhodococcus spongiicola TaxID=2487352 RepID=A0A3S3B4W6_9NOCA|nr:hypothetical protein [Rhodococcus spongiicola]RVW03266.1 hypothetical protein EF834_08870 [Rhodococcus spongiicola]